MQAGVFASRLKTEMMSRGWSAYRLAKKADLHHSTVSRILQNKTQPSMRVLCSIAAAMEITTADFFKV